jgi:hypothetical protein
LVLSHLHSFFHPTTGTDPFFADPDGKFLVAVGNLVVPIMYFVEQFNYNIPWNPIPKRHGGMVDSSFRSDGIHMKHQAFSVPSHYYLVQKFCGNRSATNVVVTNTSTSCTGSTRRALYDNTWYLQ